MTVEDIRAPGKKASPDAPDARRVVGLLADRGPMTIEQLSHRTEFPVEYVRETVRELEQRGHVATDQGFHAVDVYLIDQPTEYRLRADGGQVSGATADETLTTMEDLHIGEVATLLSPARRRAVLRLLDSVMQASEREAADSPDPSNYHPVYVPVSVIADRVEAARMGVPVSEVSSEEHRRGYISLVQVHLDVLDQHGIIEYHDRVKKVCPHPVVYDLAEAAEFVREWCGQSPARPEPLQWEASE